jgi:sugar lactone lactonase YvrE
MRRAALVITVAVAAVLVGWAGRWWWRATYPPVPRDTPEGWVPAVVTAAGGARFAEPFGVAVDGDAVYVAGAHAVWRIEADGRVRPLAGRTRGFADGAADEARFDTPSHLALAPDGSLYVADSGNHAIRRVTRDGVVTTIAGDGQPGAGDGRGARLRGPVGVAVGPTGRIFAADTYNDRIVEIADGAIRTIAGGGPPGIVDGEGAVASFDTPAGLVALDDGSLIVADTGNDAVRRISPTGGVTTVTAVDHTGQATWLWRPIGVAPGSQGRLYVTDARARVSELVGDGSRRVLAGGEPGFLDGIGTAARLRDPSGIAITPTGRLVVADTGNGLVRVLDLPERLLAWPPPPPSIPTGFDAAAFGRVPLVWPLDPQEGAHEIAGTMGEPRGNPGGDGRERFHAGVDVRADEGVLVLAVRDGSVTSVTSSGLTGALSEYVSIGPVTYVHVRVGRDREDRPLVPWADLLADSATGRLARVRVPRGTFVRAGSVVGTINRFRHVHLNVGPAGEETNALDVGLPGVVDTVPPIIAPNGITLTDLEGRPLVERINRRVVVRGPVRIVVEAYDRMNDSPPRRRLGLYRVGYQIVMPDGRPAPDFPLPHVAISFDRLPPAADAPPSLYAPGSGIPFYGTRVTRFRYLVTTRVEDGHVVEAPWYPRVPPGDYLVRALAEDAAGNIAVTGRDLPIRVGDTLTP